MSSQSKLKPEITFPPHVTHPYWSLTPATRGMIGFLTKPQTKVEDFVEEFKKLELFFSEQPEFYSQYLDSATRYLESPLAGHQWHYFVAFMTPESLQQAFALAGVDPRFQKLFGMIDFQHTFGSYVKLFPIAEPQEAFSARA
jgi:hypothetical protein